MDPIILAELRSDASGRALIFMCRTVSQEAQRKARLAERAAAQDAASALLDAEAIDPAA